MEDVKIHATAEVHPTAKLGSGTRVWNYVQIREHTHIGANCNLGKNVYIDLDVIIGDNVKIQNNVSVYKGVTIEDGVFVGPHVCFTNDKNPRAINSDGSLKAATDWHISETRIKKGASLGANSTILPGITIGEFSLIGAGSVVTKNVPAHGLVMGCPAVLKGYVCFCGNKLEKKDETAHQIIMVCPHCSKQHTINKTA